MAVRDREAELHELLRAGQTGDQRAYARFLHMITPELRAAVESRFSDLPRDAQEDTLQEIMLALHTKRHTWSPDAAVLPWCRAIARYKLIDIARRRGDPSHDALDQLGEALAADNPDDGAAALAAHDSAALIGRLDKRSARIVQAVRLEGYTTAEVGQRMAMSEGAVRVALHRAIRRLGAIVRREEQ